MTEQSKIDPKTARRTSLLERAENAFDLGSAGPRFDPKSLPKPRAKAKPVKVTVTVPQAPVELAPPSVKSVSSHSPQIEGAPTSKPEPAPEPAVALSGPYVKIDRDILRENGLIVPEDPVSALLEELRIVKRDVIADARGAKRDKDRRVLVCSPHPGEGKTYCATNLAIALAGERDVEVVLVDADVIRPAIADRLGIKESPGLMDALTDPDCLPEKLVMKTDIEGLFVLPSGSRGAHDTEYLTSARTGEVLDRLTRNAPNRFVIFDTPPALAASPAAELAAHVGQAILVVRADETSRAALEDALQLLAACSNIKLLLNATQFSPSGRSFGEYGYREQEA